MGIKTASVQKKLNLAWGDIISEMQRMYPSSNVRPTSATEIFVHRKTKFGGEVDFVMNPTVFNVPERMGNESSKLYIVLEGSLSFESVEGRNREIGTKGFHTKVGYFRYEKNVLKHIYGTHYDFEENIFGHPIFHSQIGPMLDLGQRVFDQFHLQGEIKDEMGPILRNVRIPSAQMDVFSVVAQICADHLMSKDPGIEVRNAFNKLRSSCGFFVGAAHRLKFLNSGLASRCYRSTHWYDVAT